MVAVDRVGQRLDHAPVLEPRRDATLEIDARDLLALAQ
jgi:hypothetical protein